MQTRRRVMPLLALQWQTYVIMGVVLALVLVAALLAMSEYAR